MAKNKPQVQVLEAGDIGYVPFWQIANVYELADESLYAFNSSRGGKPDNNALNKTTTFLSVHPTGWDPGFNAQVMTQLPSDCPFKFDMDDIVEARREKWQTLKDRVSKSDPTAPGQLQVFEREYVVDGEIGRPIYIVNAAITRTYCTHGANNARYNMGKDLILRIPVEVRNFTLEQDRILANLRENTVSKEGDNPIGEKGLWSAAKRLYKAGYKQVQFRNSKKSETGGDDTDEGKLFGGKGQIFFYLLEMDQQFPSLNITDRFLLDGAHPDHLNFRKFTVKNTSEANKARSMWKAADCDAWLRQTSKGDNAGTAKPKWDAVEALNRHDDPYSHNLINRIVGNNLEAAKAQIVAMRDVTSLAYNEFEGGTYGQLKEYTLAYDIAKRGGYLPELLAAVEGVRMAHKS